MRTLPRQPTHNICLAAQVRGPQTCIRALRREVEQNRVRLPKCKALIHLECRHLGIRITSGILGAQLIASPQVHWLHLTIQSQMPAQRKNAKGAGRRWEVVKLHVDDSVCIPYSPRFSALACVVLHQNIQQIVPAQLMPPTLLIIGQTSVMQIHQSVAALALEGHRDERLEPPRKRRDKRVLNPSRTVDRSEPAIVRNLSAAALFAMRPEIKQAIDLGGEDQLRRAVPRLSRNRRIEPRIEHLIDRGGNDALEFELNRLCRKSQDFFFLAAK